MDILLARENIYLLNFLQEKKNFFTRGGKREFSKTMFFGVLEGVLPHIVLGYIFYHLNYNNEQPPPPVKQTGPVFICLSGVPTTHRLAYLFRQCDASLGVTLALFWK